ncbi:Transmembrane protein 18 [Bagarius yarrelli]|uniref:Transmembrane protein 18 n=1 Tax=Bagarius yarrelli TaxID=175774 RepID=A0A556UYN6_BAGYA|nr:Transmembrane protein 18 [Bagarius yarrelli]
MDDTIAKTVQDKSEIKQMKSRNQTATPEEKNTRNGYRASSSSLSVVQRTLLVMVYSAEYLNEIAAMNWRSFTRFQYFDSKGMFISLVYSLPLLFNTLIIVMGLNSDDGSDSKLRVFQAVWVKRTFTTMTELKTLQLKRKAAKEKAKKSQ